MPALSGGDATTWRTSTPYTYSGYLWIHDPDIVFQARVNMATITYPVATLTFDTVTTGAYTDVLAGFTIALGLSAGARGLGITRVRNDATSTTIDINLTSERAGIGSLRVQDDAYITVYRERRPWHLLQRITGSPAELYKDYNIAFDGGSGGRIFTQQPGPIANTGLGPAWAGFVDPSTNVITVEFDGTASQTVTPSTTISSYAWDVDDGTITVGTASSSQITATFPEGVRYVSLTVTDSDSNTHTTYVLVAALTTGGTETPVSGFSILSQRYKRDGGSMSFEIYDENYRDVAGGSLHVYFETESYDGTEGSLASAGPSGAQHIKFAGWTNEGEQSNAAMTAKGQDRRIVRQVVSPLGILATLKAEGQAIESVGGAPTSWSEHTALSDRSLAWYLMRWHNTLHELTDILINTDVETVAGWSGGGSSQRAMLSEYETIYMAYCDRFGRIRFDDPIDVRLDDAATATIVSLTESDVTDANADMLMYPKNATVEVQGFDYSTSALTPRIAQAPGLAPTPGVEKSKFGPYWVPSQAELNRLAGLRFAEQNEPIQSLRLTMMHTGDAGIDPGVADVVVVTLGTEYFTKDQRLNSAECEIIDVTINHLEPEKRRYKSVLLTLKPVAQEYATGVDIT